MDLDPGTPYASLPMEDEDDSLRLSLTSDLSSMILDTPDDVPITDFEEGIKDGVDEENRTPPHVGGTDGGSSGTVDLRGRRFDGRDYDDAEIFKDPNPWKVAVKHVEDYLTCASPGSTTELNALRMVLVALGSLQEQPDAESVFPDVPWAHFKAVRLSMAHTGKFLFKSTFSGDQTVLDGLRQDVFTFKNMFNRRGNRVLLKEMKGDWRGVKALVKMLDSKVWREADENITADQYFDKQVEDAKEIIFTALDENPDYPELIDLLLSIGDNSVRSVKAALTFIFIDLCCVLSENHILTPDVRPLFETGRNYFAHLFRNGVPGHASTPHLARLLCEFFTFVQSRKLTIKSALEYCGAFAANTKTEETEVLIRIEEIILELSEHKITQEIIEDDNGIEVRNDAEAAQGIAVGKLICEAFPGVILNLEGFKLFLNSISELDCWFACARRGQWRKLLDLFQSRKTFVDLSQGDDVDSLLNLAAKAWAVDESSEKPLRFLVEASAHMARSNQLIPCMQKSLGNILRSLALKKLYRTLAVFCENYKSTSNENECPEDKRAPQQYVTFIGCFAPVDINSVVNESSGHTILHIACQCRFGKLIEFLINEKYANPSVKCKKGKTPSDYLEDDQSESKKRRKKTRNDMMM